MASSARAARVTGAFSGIGLASGALLASWSVYASARRAETPDCAFDACTRSEMKAVT